MNGHDETARLNARVKLGLLLSVISLGLSVSLFSRFAPTATGQDSLPGLGNYLFVFVLLPVVVTLSAVSVWRSCVRLRERVVQERHPEAIVFSSARANELQNALASLGRPLVTATLPAGFGVSVDRDGVRVWVGSLTNPRSIVSIDWAMITKIEPGIVRGLTRKSNGILFEVQFAPNLKSVTVGFPVIGRGVGWAFPLTDKDVGLLADAVVAMGGASGRFSPRT